VSKYGLKFLSELASISPSVSEFNTNLPGDPSDSQDLNILGFLVDLATGVDMLTPFINPGSIHFAHMGCSGVPHFSTVFSLGVIYPVSSNFKHPHTL
jgi:hypothetical protein